MVNLPRFFAHKKSKTNTFQNAFITKSEKNCAIFQYLWTSTVSCCLKIYGVNIQSEFSVKQIVFYDIITGNKTDENAKGIIPKTFDQIFDHISRSHNMQYLVRASYLEIYQDEIRQVLK